MLSATIEMLVLIKRLSKDSFIATEINDWTTMAVKTKHIIKKSDEATRKFFLY